ncbi:cold-regulated protein 27-like isoform X1 [Nymphaea colorata]|nr:cold-regulated protein 27-like isoform X1 [Nymphaea colorata]
MRSKRNGGDPGGLKDVPIVDGGGGGKDLCGSESEEASSGVTQELGGERPLKSEGATSMAADSAGTEWTDEKHKSYLNSMEASFVRQLYDQECFSGHPLNWLSKKRKLLNQRPTQSTIGSSPFSQFKVLQEGCWQKINFDDTSARSDAAKDKWQLFANPWIQHFATASSSKMHTITPSKFLGKASWEAEKRTCYEWNEGVSSSSQINVGQIPADCSRKHVLEIYGNTTEVSDQNFSDEEDTSLVKGSQMKKLRKWNPQASGVDKVVPLGCSLDSLTAQGRPSVDLESGD